MIEQSNVGGQNNNDIQVHGLKELDTLIKSLEPMIKNIGDASVIVPMIKDYFILK